MPQQSSPIDDTAMKCLSHSRVIRYRSLRDENLSMSAMPRKRRLAVKASYIAMGQKETYAVQQMVMNYVVSGQEQGQWYRPAHRLGGLDLDDDSNFATCWTVRVATA